MSAFDLFIAFMLIGESLLVLVLAHKLRKANKRIEEILAKPIEYWLQRERDRRLAETIRHGTQQRYGVTSSRAGSGY